MVICGFPSSLVHQRIDSREFNGVPAVSSCCSYRCFSISCTTGSPLTLTRMNRKPGKLVWHWVLSTFQPNRYDAAEMSVSLASDLVLSRLRLASSWNYSHYYRVFYSFNSFNGFDFVKDHLKGADCWRDHRCQSNEDSLHRSSSSVALV